MGEGRRIGCVWLPRFGLTVACRRDALTLQGAAGDGEDGAAREGPALATLRVALYRPDTRWQELLECAPALEACGIAAGLPLKEAQARVPDATFLPCDEATLAAIGQAFEAVVAALDAFSPTVEAAPLAWLGAGRAAVYLDAAGLAPLYGPEPQLAERLAAAAAEAAGGCPARAGIAGNKFTAWVAATLADCFTTGERCMVVPPGEEATFLAPLPLETLPLPLDARLALRRLGVGTLGRYAQLPPNAVTHRYGEIGRQAHRLARGIDETPLHPRRLQPAARVELAFDWEETELDRLTFALKVLADQLAARLVAVDDPEASSEDAFEDDAFSDEARSDSAFPSETFPEDTFSDGPFLDDLPEADVPLRPAPLPAAAAPRAAAPRAMLPRTAMLPGEKEKREEPRPRYAVEALRVVWRLSGGGEREMLLRLAEPAASAAAFAEHLRWHAEGLDRFLAQTPDPPQTASATALSTRAGSAEEGSGGAASGGGVGNGASLDGGLTYHSIEQRLGVIGIALEAVGVHVPGGTQLKLLASPLQWTAAEGSAAAVRLNPAARAQRARRAVARLQARWGAQSVWQATLTESRLPERSVRAQQPALDLQIGEGIGLARREAKAGTQHAPTLDDASPLVSHLPLWLLDPPEPVLVLNPRRKGGKRLFTRGARSSGARAAGAAPDEEATGALAAEAAREEGAAHLAPSETQRAEGKLFLLSAPSGGARLLVPAGQFGPPRRSSPTWWGSRERTNTSRGAKRLRITHSGGPWKLVDPTALCTGEPLRRAYYHVETEDGRAYLVYRDLITDAWFLQGVFD